MTREETELGVITALRGVDVERPDADDWFKQAAYAMGVEPGSASVDYWDSTQGPVEAQMACRVNGKRYEVRAIGEGYDGASRAVLDQLALEIMADGPVPDAGHARPTH